MTTMKAIFASTLLLAACGSDPLDPGAGDDLGGGTNTLFVDGRAHAEPRIANARAATDFDTEISIRVLLNDAPVTSGTVIVSSRFGEAPLTWQADPGRWEGRMAGYDEVYRLDVESGADKVTNVIVDGPDIHVFTAPTAGATLDSTQQNAVTWSRDESADITAFDSGEIDKITIADTGSYMMSPGALKAEKDKARDDQLELSRTNHVAPRGAIAGSDFAVTVTNRIDVVVAPNPAL